INGILQNPPKHRRRGGSHDRAECDEDAHENPACTIITIVRQNEDFSYRDKTDNGYRAIFYGSQGVYCCLREYFILSDISQNLKCLIEAHEKRNRPNVRIGQERIIKVYLKKRRVCVPALDVRFPEQESKGGDADEHKDYLKEYC